MEAVQTVKELDLVIKQLETLKANVEVKKVNEHNIVVHNNEVLVEVDRKAKPGDYVIFNGIKPGYTKDDVFYKTYEEDGAVFYTGENELDFKVYGWEFSCPNPKVYEVVGTLPQSAVEVECNHLTANQKRARVIAMAKQFAEETIKNARDRDGDIEVPDPNSTFSWTCSHIRCEVNDDKRTVVALAYGYADGTVVKRAVAKCAPDDVFNADIGKAIAVSRLFGKDVSKFENAVQPNALVKGMGVIWMSADGIVYERKVQKIDGDKVQFTNGYWLSKDKTEITDDTNAEYTLKGGDK